MSDEDFTDEEISLGAQLAEALANAEKAQYDANHAKWHSLREELAYKQERLEHEWQLDGVYAFHKAVTQKSADKLLHAMSVWHRHNPEAGWTIYLNSVGGSEYAGYGVIDELRAHSLRGGGSHHVTIKVRGVAASMGGMILQAADERIMGKYSMLMIHRGGCQYTRYMSADEIYDEAEWQRQSTDRMIALFLERANGLTRPDVLDRITRKDWWITADEAVRFGLVDGIG